MARNEFAFTERIYRSDNGGEVLVSSKPVDPIHYNLVGTDPWETAEQTLVEYYDQHDDRTDKLAGDWRILVTARDGSMIVELARNLPLHPAYAALTYKTPASSDQPVRAFVVRLAGLYPGADLNLIAEHLDDFTSHYDVQISTEELANRTGYRLPEGRPRPVTPFSPFEHPDDIPETLR